MGEGDRRRLFEDLVAEVADPVRRFLWRRTDAETAQDVLAETLLVLWRAPRPADAAPIPWALSVARRQLANADRAQRRRDRLTAKIIAVDPPQEAVVRDGFDGADDVRAILAALRPADAEILRLWSWDELPPRQIAVVLGIGVNAATVRLHRARERFRREWSKAQDRSGHVAVEGAEPW